MTVFFLFIFNWNPLITYLQCLDKLRSDKYNCIQFRDPPAVLVIQSIISIPVLDILCYEPRTEERQS